VLDKHVWRFQLAKSNAACRYAGAQALSRVLNACTRAPVNVEETSPLYAGRVRSLLRQSNTHDLSLIVHALAHLQLRDDELLIDVARELQNKLRKCKVLEASMIANAYARLGFAEQTLFGQLIPSFVEKNAHRFEMKDLTQVLNAYAKLQLRSTAVFSALSSRCIDQADHMDCFAVSIVLNAHARLMIMDLPLFQRMADKLRACAHTCTLQAHVMCSMLIRSLEARRDSQRVKH